VKSTYQPSLETFLRTNEAITPATEMAAVNTNRGAYDPVRSLRKPPIYGAIIADEKAEVLTIPRALFTFLGEAMSLGIVKHGPKLILLPQPIIMSVPNRYARLVIGGPARINILKLIPSPIAITATLFPVLSARNPPTKEAGTPIRVKNGSTILLSNLDKLPTSWT